jgi:hypothetical protein
LNDLLHQACLLIHQLETGTDFHFSGDTDFTLITGGQKFAPDQGLKQ